MPDPDEPRDRVQLSLVQVAGSAAASVTAAVLCSFFGVAGTVIGTAAASALVTIGSALYSYSLRRTQNRLRRLHQAGAAAPPVTAVIRTAREHRTRLVSRLRWRIVLLGTANVFVFSIGFVTGLEGLLGQSLAAEFGVSHSGRDSTSLGSVFDSKHHPRKTSTPTPSKSSTTPTPAVTSTTAPVTPTPQPSTSTITPTGSPTPTQTGLLPSGLLSSSSG